MTKIQDGRPNQSINQSIACSRVAIINQLFVITMHNNKEDCFEVWNLALKVWGFNGKKYTPI